MLLNVLLANIYGYINVKFNTHYRGFRSLGTFCVGFSPREHKMAKIDRRVWAAPPASLDLRSFSQKKFGAGRPCSNGAGPQTVGKK
jgi:hypothetical protein